MAGLSYFMYNLFRISIFYSGVNNFNSLLSYNLAHKVTTNLPIQSIQTVFIHTNNDNKRSAGRPGQGKARQSQPSQAESSQAKPRQARPRRAKPVRPFRADRPSVRFRPSVRPTSV